MSRTTEITRFVTIIDILPEQPPAILTSETVKGPGGKPRLFTQKIQVLDADLWSRLTTEVQKGDTIQLTAKTVWPDKGRYYTCLDSFSRLELSANVAELAGASA